MSLTIGGDFKFFYEGDEPGSRYPAMGFRVPSSDVFAVDERYIGDWVVTHLPTRMRLPKQLTGKIRNQAAANAVALVVQEQMLALGVPAEVVDPNAFRLAVKGMTRMARELFELRVWDAATALYPPFSSSFFGR